MRRTRRSWILGCLALLLGVGTPMGCRQAPSDPRPNVLWIVWDTARADHMSVYGYERPTTPFLEQWAADARVFENSLSTAGYTLPSHASMFTGLLPSEHCTHNDHKRLDDAYTTIAELLQGDGYRTYLYSANPHIGRMGNFIQGFDAFEHPWSPQYHDRALELVRQKLPEYDHSSELRERLDGARTGGGLTPWNIKAAGELAVEAASKWLGDTDGERPYFVFLNYMEAHRPYIPPRKFREQLMTPEQVEASYGVDRSFTSMWEYVFRLRDYSDEELELTRLTYDASLLELDGMLEELLERLEAEGHLDNTVVVLTSDHGEHLGEQHMMDHQYSLYQPLLRVPLIVHYPEKLEPGRDTRPVMNFDVFPTLLELTGVDTSQVSTTSSRSLLDPEEGRRRLAEEPAYAALGVRLTRQRHPEWDPSPWQRQLRAWVDGDDKLIWSSNAPPQLFDLATDPMEERDRHSDEPQRSAELLATMDAYHRALPHCQVGEAPEEPTSPETRELLKSLGYAE